MATPLWINRGGVLRRGFLKGSDLALLPSTTPPLNPSGGDLWIYPTGNGGGMWTFVYDSTEVGPYKWKFIGGSPVSKSYGGGPQTNTVASTWQPWTAPGFITVDRAGDYTVQMVGTVVLTATATQVEGLMTTAIYNTGTGIGGDSISIIHPGAGTTTFVTEFNPLSFPATTTLAAGTQVGIATWSNPTAGCQYFNPSWSLVPVRIA